MKLMYVAPHLSNVGGLERTLTNKANYMAEQGHDVRLLTYAEHQTKIFYPLHPNVGVISLDTPFHQLFHYPAYARLWYYFHIRRNFRNKMRQAVSDFQPDVVVITIPNTEDFIYDIVSAAGHAKVVIESHLAADYHLVNLSSTEKVIYRFYPPLEAIKKADLLITLTEKDAESWRKRGVKNVVTIPNPIPRNCHSKSQTEKLPGRIIAVGRLDDQKRHDRLIEAFALIADKHPSWYIDLFGNGQLYDDLMAQIQQSGLDGRINILDPVEDIFSEYGRSQFFVLSSDYEGFSLVIVEAMACGIPVVSTNCPCGPAEIINDGVTGLLAQVNAADLAEKMEWMITHESERRLMGEKSLLRVSDFAEEKVMVKWINAYKSVLA